MRGWRATSCAKRADGMTGKPPCRMAGVKVLDIATFLAAPFAGTILADFGATVLKIEHPKLGDPDARLRHADRMRRHPRLAQRGAEQACMTLDLRHPKGRRCSAGWSRNPTWCWRISAPARWRNGASRPTACGRSIRSLVVLRVSAYGQTGPKRGLPGFARVAHGFGGLSYLAGEPDGRPVVPGSTSLADYLSGIWGAVGVLMALRVAERTGQRPGRRYRPL